MGWKLVVRHGAKVVKSRHEDLGAALLALEAALDAVPTSGTVRTVFRREYEPGDQVVARAELAGPRRVRGGVDLRGDGTAEAWTGRVAKQLVEVVADERPHDALGRALAARAPHP